MPEPLNRFLQFQRKEACSAPTRTSSARTTSSGLPRLRKNRSATGTAWRARNWARTSTCSTAGAWGRDTRSSGWPMTDDQAPIAKLRKGDQALAEALAKPRVLRPPTTVPDASLGTHSSAENPGQIRGSVANIPGQHIQYFRDARGRVFLARVALARKEPILVLFDPPELDRAVRACSLVAARLVSAPVARRLPCRGDDPAGCCRPTTRRKPPRVE
jgi:hypothetical protein